VRWRLRHRREQHLDSTPEPALRSSDPAARGARARRSGAGHSPLHRFERAADRFNDSEAGHTVRGLVKTLGDPWVSVGAAAGTADEVRVTVAWDLAWYQWGVDLGDELRPVFQIDKGNEVEQLDRSARQWNASAAEGGRVVLGAPAGGRERNGEAVG
jgi:hypothetical protein